MTRMADAAYAGQEHGSCMAGGIGAASVFGNDKSEDDEMIKKAKELGLIT